MGHCRPPSIKTRSTSRVGSVGFTSGGSRVSPGSGKSGGGRGSRRGRTLLQQQQAAAEGVRKGRMGADGTQRCSQTLGECAPTCTLRHGLHCTCLLLKQRETYSPGSP